VKRKHDILGAIGYFLLIALATYVGIKYGLTQLVYDAGALAWCFVTMLLYIHTLKSKYTNIVAGGGAFMAFVTFIAELMDKNTSLSSWHIVEAWTGICGMIIALYIQYRLDKKNKK